MSKDYVSRIKSNSSFDDIPLKKILDELEDSEKYSLDYLFRAYDNILEFGATSDLIKRLSKNSYWEDDFFKQAGYLKLPLSFYLDFLPTIYNEKYFSGDVFKGILGLYTRIIHSMKSKNMSFEEEI